MAEPEPASWHFVLGGKATGPVPAAALVHLALRGALDQGTLVWSPGMGEWAPLGGVPALAQALAGAGAAEDPGACMHAQTAGLPPAARTGHHRTPPLPAPHPAAAKRARMDAAANAPSPEVAHEIAAWAEALDAASRLALFERALFRHLADAIQARSACVWCG